MFFVEYTTSIINVTLHKLNVNCLQKVIHFDFKCGLQVSELSPGLAKGQY